MNNWRLYGMWFVLDTLLALFLFTLVPVFTGIYLAQGIFYYFHMFVASIAGILLIATFLAFHAGSLINISHRVIKGAKDWWHWIVFHWAMIILVSSATLFLLFIGGPIFTNPSVQIIGVGIILLSSLILLHFMSVWQYFFLKERTIMPAFFLSLRKAFGRRLSPLLSWMIFAQVILFIFTLFAEQMLAIFVPLEYERFDVMLVRLYYMLAFALFYTSLMRKRKLLFG
jgi:hypothetical protein